MWGGDGVGQAEQEADELIDIVASFKTKSTSSAGTTTYEELAAQRSTCAGGRSGI